MSIFKFKQFSIQQKLSAAKVGTDGVLLGAWVDIQYNPKEILDIGTGTGLIALMLAQRTPSSVITAIDMDKEAYTEALLNFKNSPWPNRIKAIHTSLQDYHTEEKFDLITSNPPYHTEQVYALDRQRSMARSALYLSFEELITKSATLLNPNGKLAVIIPYTSEETFVDIAKQNELFANKICHIRGTASSPIKRSLMTFSKVKSAVDIETLTIEKARHHYTKKYIDYTKAFYLNM